MSFPEKAKQLEGLLIPEVISSARRIYSMLRPFLDDKKKLLLRLENKNFSIKTTLLEIDIDNEVLVAYRTTPTIENEQLHNTDKASIELSYEGMSIHFDSELLNHYHEEGIAYYEFRFPDTIECCQRRSAYRHIVDEKTSIAFKLNTDDGNHYRGIIYDISSNGLRICFAKESNISLTRKNVLSGAIHFPNGELIECQLRVSHIQQAGQNNQYHVGGYFENLDNMKKQIIEKFIMDMEDS